jgi:phenylpropionate dioxygenase-like ring-hydroxylating dioxygenase large terminal subunit
MKQDEILPASNPAWGEGGVKRVETMRYTSRAYHEREKKHLWPNAWQFACREEEIEEPGSFFEYEINDQSVVIVRTNEGAVKAFYNVCLHRGTQLVKGCGKQRQFTCPFHSWRWSLDGEIRYVHDRADFPGVTDAELRLPEVQVGLFGGFVFIKLNEGGQGFEEFLAPIANQLAAYRFEEYRIQSWRSTILKANWKVALEAFEESYHLLGTHPQGRVTGADVGTVYELYGPHSLSKIPTGTPSPRMKVQLSEAGLLEYMINAFLDTQLADAKQVEILEKMKGMPLPQGMTTRQYFQKMAMERYGSYLPDLVPEQFTMVYDYTIFPNFVFNVTAGNVFGFRARPYGDDPDYCIFEVISLQHPCDAPATERVEREVITEPDYNWGTALTQDYHNLARIQAGMHAPSFTHMRLAAYQESRVYNRIRAMDEMFSPQD